MACIKVQFEEQIKPKQRKKFHILSDQIPSFRLRPELNLNLIGDNIELKAITPPKTKSVQSLSSSISIENQLQKVYNTDVFTQLTFYKDKILWTVISKYSYIWTNF